MLGLLNAYVQSKNPPAYQREYTNICLQFLSQSLPSSKIRTYEVALGNIPATADECEMWIISGSPLGVYDEPLWIHQLGEFVRNCHQRKQKMIGICFGHQLIAHFLGGKTEKSKKGWGVGVRTFNIIRTKPWMTPPLKKVSLLFSHQDQVVKLPPTAELLAEDEFCPHQMFSIEDHIFCLQGHPEFTPAFVRDRLNSRASELSQQSYDKALESLNGKTHVIEIAQWLKRFAAMVDSR